MSEYRWLDAIFTVDTANSEMLEKDEARLGKFKHQTRFHRPEATAKKHGLRFTRSRD